MERKFMGYGLTFSSFSTAIKALKQFRSPRFKITPCGELIGRVEVNGLLKLEPTVVVYGMKDDAELQWVLDWLSGLGFSDSPYELVEAYKSENGVWSKHTRGFYRV